MQMYHPNFLNYWGTPEKIEEFKRNFYDMKPFLTVNERLKIIHKSEDAGIEWPKMKLPVEDTK